MRRLLAIVVPSICVAMVLAQPAPKAGKNYAFLVGVSGYKKTELKPLPYTPDDVEGFKQALLTTGFDNDTIVMMHDRQASARYLPERKKILQELDLLLDGLHEQDTLVVALSGHGVHFRGEKTGYFCPLDAKIDDKSSLIAMEGPGGIFDLLKNCRASTKLLIVNACRNDPFGDLAQAARKGNFDDEDKDDVPEGIAAIYSCKEGQRSYYDPDRKRGIFFDHVIRAWKGEYDGAKQRSIESFFEQVEAKTRLDANRTLGEKQYPQVKREYKGRWVITSNTTPSTPSSPGPAPTLDVDLGNGVKIEMVLIPAGKFWMGSPKDEKDRNTWDKTLDAEEQVEVEITTPFYMAKYETTQAQWRAVLTDNPSDAKGDDLPVNNVSWDEAQRFVRALNQKAVTRAKFRLPTEAEWEYACRAGDTSKATKPYYFKDGPSFTLAPEQGNFGYTGKPLPVGSHKNPNRFGLHEMHGNIWEWCEDYYGPLLGGKDPVRTTRFTDGENRVLRGGSFANTANNCRAADRGWSAASSGAFNFVGFRLCLPAK